jgi:hypothetical protein
MNGVFFYDCAPMINIKKDDGNKVFLLEFPNAEEEKFAELFHTLVEKRSVSGGVNCKMDYSPTLRSIAGNLCTVRLHFSTHFVVEMMMRMVSEKEYDGVDPCFPYRCNKH